MSLESVRNISPFSLNDAAMSIVSLFRIVRLSLPTTLDRIGSWAYQHVGTKYDYSSLFKQAIGRVSANAHKLFCSEFWFLACKQAGVPLTGKAPRPGDIPKLDVFAKKTKILSKY